MRKKIGKRIGPVPITLVAVLALAAFISAGLLIASNPGTSQAQDYPAGAGITNPPTEAKKCEVDIIAEGLLSGGGCIANGDSVEVNFLNNATGQDPERNAVVYVTGGSEFPSVQATKMDGTALGEEGVDEYILEIDGLTSEFGTMKPGSESVTVTRDMAKDGKVYLFAYATAGDDLAFAPDDAPGIPLSVLVSDSTRSMEFENEALDSDNNNSLVMLRSLANDLRTAALGSDGNDEDEDVSGAIDKDTPTVDTDDVPVVAVVKTSQNAGDDAKRTNTDLEQTAINEAQAILDAVMAHENYSAFKSSGTNATNITDVMREIREAQAVVDAIQGGAPDYFPNSTADFAVLVEFRATAVEAKKSGAKYVHFDNDKMGSTIYVGRESDMVTADDVIRAGTETATISVVIRDGQGVPLAGFVDFSIDTTADGAADAVFDKSNRPTHYEELVGGMVTVKVTDLPKTDPIRIPVTVNFNNDELELKGYITRKGDATVVAATAYECMRDVGDHEAEEDLLPSAVKDVEAEDACLSEIEALKTSQSSDDPDEVVSLGPEAMFFISAKATDAVGNSVGSGAALSWKITADSDNEADAKKAIVANSGKTNETIMIISGEDAIAGTYSITVTSPDGEASTMIMITVSAEASKISVSCDPEMIPTDSGLTDCTVTVTDANDNIPSNLVNDSADPDDDSRVLVIVRSEGASLSGVDDAGYTDLDAKGMASFSVVLHEDAREGDVTIFVSTDNVGITTLRANSSVMYGEAAPMPEPMPMTTELTAPSGVVVSSLANTQSISVTWDTTSIENAQQVKVVLFNSDVTAVAKPLITINAANDMGSATFNDVPDGMYNVVVASFRTGERHKLSPLQEVTVE